MLNLSQSAQIIVNEMKATIHKDINIMDENGVIIASTNPARISEVHTGAQAVLREKMEYLTVFQPSPGGMMPGINLPIRMDRRTVGVIGITGKPEEVSVFGSVIQKMTEIMMEGIRQKEGKSLISDARAQFIGYWLFAEPVDPDELRLRSVFCGVDIFTPRVVAFLNIYSPSGLQGFRNPADASVEMETSRYISQIRAILANSAQDDCFTSDSSIILMLGAAIKGRALTLLSEIQKQLEATNHIKFSGGISSLSQGPADIRRCYKEAKTAASVAKTLKRGRLIQYNETSLEFIAQSIAAELGQNMVDIVFSNCPPELIAEFIETTLLYFQEKGNLDHMAERLYVHRNTIQYRIIKLLKHTGYDLRTPRDACLLYFASSFYHRPENVDGQV